MSDSELSASTDELGPDFSTLRRMWSQYMEACFDQDPPDRMHAYMTGVMHGSKLSAKRWEKAARAALEVLDDLPPWSNAGHACNLLREALRIGAEDRKAAGLNPQLTGPAGPV